MGKSKNRSRKSRKSNGSAVSAPTSPKLKSKSKDSRSPKKKRPSGSCVSIAVDGSNDQSKHPIVVSFPSGLPQALTASQEDILQKGQFPEFYWQQSQSGNDQRTVAGRDENCVYTATSAASRSLSAATKQEPGEDAAQPLPTRGNKRATKLCVGVYDKRTRTLRITQAASGGAIFSLQQSVPTYHEDENTLGRSSSINDRVAMEYGRLFEDFGSSKKRKVLKSQRANQVDPNFVVGASEGQSALVTSMLKGAAMSSSNREAIEMQLHKLREEGGDSDDANAALKIRQMATGADAAYAAARKEFLPPYDEHTKEPRMVYKARDIVGKDVWAKFHKQATYVLKNHHSNALANIMALCKEESDWNQCIKKIIEEMISTGGDRDSDQLAHQLTCAIITNWMMNFYAHCAREKFLAPVNPTASRYFGIPTEIASYSVHKFANPISFDTGKTGFAMTKAKRDKFLVHTFLLFMIAQGPAMTIPDLNGISSELKLPVVDAGQLLRMAGCVAIKNSKKTTAVALKLPLVFPGPRRAARSKR